MLGINTNFGLVWSKVIPMSQKKHEILPLFIEPYFKTNIGHAIGKKQIDFLKSLKMIQNQTNLISENLSIFEEPELKSLKKAVQDALDIYAEEVMGISNKLYVTQSWSLINHTNVGMHGHTHSNSIISGSLYFHDMPTPTAGMIFERHKTYQRLELYPEQGKANLYNTTKNIVVPQKNDLLLFGSDLLHLVQPNVSMQPRHSVAFNTFVKGDLGSHRDVSALSL